MDAEPASIHATAPVNLAAVPGPPETNSNPYAANGNNPNSTITDNHVRVPDYEDAEFGHEEFWDSSPYLDAVKTKRSRFGSMAMFGTRKPSRDRIAAVALLVVVLFIVMTVTVTGPSRQSKDMIALEKHNVYFPRELDEQFAQWTQRDDDNDVAFFWDVPLSGGNVVEDILGSCFKLVQASDVGKSKEDVHSGNSLQIVEVYGDEYVNIDTTTIDGINKAIRLDLAASGLADVVHSPYLREGGQLFHEPNKGRLFTLIRHPIQRAVHLFHYLSEAKWDGYYQPQLKDITIEQYAESNWVENNYLTRILVNKPGGALTREDVDLAKEILRRKALIGLFDRMFESMFRFERYFGWRMNTEKRTCQQRLMEQGMSRYEYTQLQMGSDAWILLLRQNKFDMEVYNYAVTLFDYQGTTMFANM